MPRKKIPAISTINTKAAGLISKLNKPPAFKEYLIEPQPNIQKLIEYLSIPKPKAAEEMFFFIMYDIENNKVRRLVAKYLEKKGCMRVQKSIFFAKLHRNMYREITETLKEIQQAYENADSILALPVGEDMLNNLKIIGKELSYEFSNDTKNTLFF